MLQSWAFLVAQIIKNLPEMWETWVRSKDRVDPLEKEWLPTPVFLPGESYRQRSLVGYTLYDYLNLKIGTRRSRGPIINYTRVLDHTDGQYSWRNIDQGSTVCFSYSLSYELICQVDHRRKKGEIIVINFLVGFPKTVSSNKYIYICFDGVR